MCDLFFHLLLRANYPIAVQGAGHTPPLYAFLISASIRDHKFPLRALWALCIDGYNYTGAASCLKFSKFSFLVNSRGMMEVRMGCALFDW